MEACLMIPPLSVVSIQNGQLTMSSTDDVYEVYCSPGSIGFEEPMEVARGGKIYKAELRGFIPKDCAESEKALTDIAGRRYVAVYLDQNEQYKVVGTRDIPLRVTIDLDTGSDTNDRNGHKIIVSGEQITKSVFVSNPFA